MALNGNVPKGKSVMIAITALKPAFVLTSMAQATIKPITPPTAYSGPSAAAVPLTPPRASAAPIAARSLALSVEK